MEDFKLNSLYVSVKDMGRAVLFYEKLFRVEADDKNDRYSIFKFGEFYFGLYNPGHDGFDIKYGENCIPNFEVEDIEQTYEHVKNLTNEVDKKILDISNMKLFQFKDPEGNILEIYSYKK